MLLPSPTREVNAATAPAVPAIARFLPSLTDIAFLMPLIFLFVKLQGARTLLGDGDTGWHLKTGEWMLDNHAVPHTDMFSFSRPGAPWYAWEWLWDLAGAVLFRKWGMPAIVFVSAAVICLTSALLFRLVRRKCDNGLVAIAVTLLATGGCSIHWLARPHLFTLLFFTITLHITERAHEGRVKLLWWLVPLTLLWTNLHGGFFVVFLTLACYIGSDLLNAVIERDPAMRRNYLTGTKTWFLAGIACFAMTFINPYGWQLHKHVVDYLTDPYQLQHISEFQSVNFHSPVVVYFEPLMIAALLAALWAIGNRRFSDVFLAAGWLHLALIAQRNVPLFCIACAPLIAAGLMAVIRAAGKAQLVPWIGRMTDFFVTGTASVDETDRIGRLHLISVFVLAVIALLLHSSIPVNEKFISTYDPKSYPEKALPLLLAKESGRIFAEDEWGDYLIYKMYPQKKVFVDGRSDFYGDDFGNKYLDVMNVKWDWEKTLDKYAIDTIAISPKFALSSTLKLSRNWRLVYDDHITLVFRHNVSNRTSLVSSDEGKPRGQAITKTNNRGLKTTQPNT